MVTDDSSVEAGELVALEETDSDVRRGTAIDSAEVGGCDCSTESG